MRLPAKLVAEGWADLQKLSGNSVDHLLGYWAEEVLAEAIRSDADYAWEIIVEINKLELRKKDIPLFAAGPVEDLLVYKGREVVDKMVRFAEENDTFNYVLGGVWKSDCYDDVWEKIDAVRKHRW